MSNTEKSFNERLSEWRKKHPITKEELDAIDRKRSVERADELLVDCVPGPLDINGFPDDDFKQED